MEPVTSWFNAPLLFKGLDELCLQVALQVQER